MRKTSKNIHTLPPFFAPYSQNLIKKRDSWGRSDMNRIVTRITNLEPLTGSREWYWGAD